MEVLTRAAGLFGRGVDLARSSLQVRKVQTSEAPFGTGRTEVGNKP